MTSQDLKAAISVLLASGRASQSELAKRSGVAQPLISRFVNDPDAGITLDNACKLVAAINAGGFSGRADGRGRMAKIPPAETQA